MACNILTHLTFLGLYTYYGFYNPDYVEGDLHCIVTGDTLRHPINLYCEPYDFYDESSVLAVN